VLASLARSPARPLARPLARSLTRSQGKLISNVARINLDGVVAAANDKHVEPWGKICAEAGIDTVLSPYIHRELLGNNHVHVDGRRVVEETGFEYAVPRLEKGVLRDMILDAVENGLFPRSLVGEGEREEGDGEAPRK
jgi:hypothetical protein